MRVVFHTGSVIIMSRKGTHELTYSPDGQSLCEYCGSAAPFPDGGCESNLIHVVHVENIHQDSLKRRLIARKVDDDDNCEICGQRLGDLELARIIDDHYKKQLHSAYKNNRRIVDKCDSQWLTSLRVLPHKIRQEC